MQSFQIIFLSILFTTVVSAIDFTVICSDATDSAEMFVPQRCEDLICAENLENICRTTEQACIVLGKLRLSNQPFITMDEANPLCPGLGFLMKRDDQFGITLQLMSDGKLTDTSIQLNELDFETTVAHQKCSDVVRVRPGRIKQSNRLVTFAYVYNLDDVTSASTLVLIVPKDAARFSQ